LPDVGEPQSFFFRGEMRHDSFCFYSKTEGTSDASEHETLVFVVEMVVDSLVFVKKMLIEHVVSSRKPMVRRQFPLHK